MDEIILSEKDFNKLQELVSNTQPPKEGLKRLCKLLSASENAYSSKEDEILIDWFKAQLEASQELYGQALGSYNKPYIWDEKEINYNLQEDIGFELEKLIKDGRITTEKEVTSVIKKVLDGDAF